jgi:hypothetical protein
MAPRNPKIYRGDLRAEHKRAHSKAIRTARHLLAEANREEPRPYVPASLSRPYGKEARRRLMREVNKELAELKKEEE